MTVSRTSRDGKIIEMVSVVVPSASARFVVTRVSPGSQSSHDSVLTIRSPGTISR
jgi:hypothetical protein